MLDAPSCPDNSNLMGKGVEQGRSRAQALTSVLFVPGSRPDRLPKALASGADLVCVDLEDAVPADGKAAAREAAVAAVAPGVAVRVNAPTTRDGLADLLALADAGAPELVFVPKAEEPGHLDVAAGALGPDTGLVPLIETPRGLRHALAIASHPSVAAVMFGGGDMAGELGVALAWEPLAAARGALLLACAEAGRPAIDVPWIALDDEEGLADECRRARALGFAAKAAIHPAQVPAIRAAFSPSPDLVAEARAATAAYRAANGAAVRFNGRMLEVPIMRRYERVLAQADRREADA